MAIVDGSKLNFSQRTDIFQLAHVLTKLIVMRQQLLSMRPTHDWFSCACVRHFMAYNNKFLVGFKSIRVDIFYANLPKPNATLLLYPGLGPAMLRRLRRESLPIGIGGVPMIKLNLKNVKNGNNKIMYLQ